MSENIKQLLETFFQSVAIKKWAQCDEIIQKVNYIASVHSKFALYPKFLEAVLTYIRHGDLGLAAEQMNGILLKKLPDDLRWQVMKELAIVNGMLGEFQKTINLCERAIEIIPDSELTPKIKLRHNIAIALSFGFDQGDFSSQELEKAIHMIDTSLYILDALPASKTNQKLREEILNTKGIVLKSLDNLEDAEKNIRQSIEFYHESNNKLYASYGQNSLGEILQSKGASFWNEAEEAYKHALALHEQVDGEWDGVKVDILANLGELSRNRGNYQEALTYYQRAIRGAETLRGNITGANARAGFFSTLSSVYEHAILLCVALKKNELAFDLMEQARARSFVEIISQKKIDLPPTITQATLTFSEVQNKLKQTDLILSYFTTGQAPERSSDDKTPHYKRHRFPRATSLIFAVSTDGVEVSDTEIPPNEIQPQAKEPSFLLNPSISKSIYAALIKPFEVQIIGKERLYFMPHGPIHTIPLHALLAENGQPIVHENGPLILYSPSASILFQREKAETPVALETLRSCLALGYSGTGVNKIEQAEKNARHIASLWNGDAIVGTFPKIDRLIKESGRYRYIHFACHGKFNMDDPLQSELLLAENERLTAEMVISSLKLNCELVILSACETGMTRIHRGDEHDGLVRAFMIAGAKMVLTANWEIPDHSTAILMAHFHTLLKSGIEPAVALKEAQLYLKNLTVAEAEATYKRLQIGNFPNQGKRPDAIYFDQPAYWSAFTLKVRSQTSDSQDR